MHSKFTQILSAPEVYYVSYNMGTHALPDIQCPLPSGLQPSGFWHTYQETKALVPML